MKSIRLENELSDMEIEAEIGVEQNYEEETVEARPCRHLPETPEVRFTSEPPLLNLYDDSSIGGTLAPTAPPPQLGHLTTDFIVQPVTSTPNTERAKPSVGAKVKLRTLVRL